MSPSTFPNHLRIATADPQSYSHDPMYVTTSGKKIYNTHIELLLLFSNFLNFSYTIVAPRDKSDSWSLDDGNWTGVMGMLQRGEADMSFHMWEVGEYNDIIDYAYPLRYERVTFMTQPPQPIVKEFILLQPFSGSLWTAVLASSLGFFVLFCAISCKSRRCIRSFFSTLGNVLGQPFSVPLTSKAQVFLFIGWILAISFLIHSFKSIFLSFLLLVPTKGINTIDELVSSIVNDSLMCMELSGFSTHVNLYLNTLTEETPNTYSIIRKCIDKYFEDPDLPNIYFDPYSTQKTCYIAPESSLRMYRQMMISKDSFYYEMRAFPLRKNFQGKNVLDKTIERVFQTGLYQKLDNDFWLILSLLFLDLEPSPEGPVINEEILTLDDLKGAFLILVGGLSLSLLFFLGEILVFNLSRRLKLRNRIQQNPESILQDNSIDV